MQREEGASELDNQEIDHYDDHPDDEECRVCKEAIAEVELVVDLAGSNHVDDLEPDKQIEDERHVT